MNFGGHFTDLIKLEKIQSLSISIFLDSLKDTRGGNGANIAYSMALLGNNPVLLGSVGAEAEQYMADLKKIGVQADLVHRSRLPTASFNVFTDGGDRQIGGFYPGAMFDSDSLTLLPLKAAAPFIVIAPHDPKAMRRQVQECKENGLRLFYDVGQQVTNIGGEDIQAGLEIAELLIINDYELSVICQKTGRAEAEIKSRIPVVITTLGSEGSVIEGKNVPQPVRVGIARPKRVADPTGAGDAYRAGFLHGYIRNWDLKTSAQLGAVCASYAIEQLGTQGHTFNLNLVAQRYQQAFNEALPI